MFVALSKENMGEHVQFTTIFTVFVLDYIYASKCVLS